MDDEIRVGKVSAVDYAAGTVRVVYHDKDDSVTPPFPMLSSEYQMPQVGDMVLVLHLSNGKEVGIVLGRPWSEKHKPPEGGENLYRKELGRKPGEAMIRYDGSTMTIKCTGIITIDADAAININSGGAITINGASIDLN